MKETLDSVGSRIKWARKRKHWGQIKFAQEMGLSQQAISQWEKGDTSAPRDMHKAADILEVSYKWLAYGDGKPDITDDELVKKLNRLETHERQIVETFVESLLSKHKI